MKHFSPYIERHCCSHNGKRKSGFTAVLFSVLLFTVFTTTVSAQSLMISGTVADKNDKTTIPGVYVTITELKDSTNKHNGITDAKGTFTISNLDKKPCKVVLRCVGYQTRTLEVTPGDGAADLGLIFLTPDSKMLDEVVVNARGTAIQRGDTTIMSADAFKVNPDATAEDLVKKMPGITVENGTIKAHGEEVKKVLVDGKQFFGDDPSVALKNLPSYVIDKVQVYNKLSDQAELTGFDDGESSKTINLVTKKFFRTGQFGKFTGGTDFQDKYLLSGNLNVFKGPRRISVNGTLNNVNQQNFNMQDLVGSRDFHGGSRGGNEMNGGTFGGMQGGITKTQSFGINYGDTWGKKVTVNGSYFYNSTDNNLEKLSNTEYLYIEDGRYAKSNSASDTKNYNHRFNLRIEYAIDSLNSLIISPRLSLQTNKDGSSSETFTTGGLVNSVTAANANTSANALSMSSDITWRHKFLKPRRTFSLGITASDNTNDSKDKEWAMTDSVPDNQYNDGNTDGYGISANLNYTEPVGENAMLRFGYNSSYNYNNTNKYVYRMGDQAEMLGQIDSLSNVYNSDYYTNRGGISYLYRTNNIQASAGVDYQWADLSGKEKFPSRFKVDKTFRNFLPSLMFNYKISKTTNLRLFYRTNTTAPSISQLQEVVNNTNRLALSTGNPDLRQQYNHMLMANYIFTNPTSGFNAFVFLNGEYTDDYISSKTIYAQSDTLYLPKYNVRLLPGSQLSYPVNLDHSISLRGMFTVGYFVKPIKCNVTLVNGLSYSQTPGYIDSLLNRSNDYNITNSLIIASNISEKVDFTVSYTSNYSIVRNSASSKNISNTEYWYQSANFRLNCIFWKNLVFQTDVAGQYNQGLSQSYNQSSVVWNASLGKKFLKNNAAELKLGINDILNQNKNIKRSVTASSIQDTRTNTFPRYFMIQFTFNLKNFSGQPPVPNGRGPYGFPGREGMPEPPAGGERPFGPPPGAVPGGGFGPGEHMP
jgi:hypothetical protein